MTERLGGDLMLKLAVSDGGERLWILFDRGVAHPLVILTDYQASNLAKAIQAAQNK